MLSCRQDSTGDSTEVIPLGEETNFTQLVYGKVVNESGVALSNVDVRAKGQTATTDDNGLFIFEQIDAGNRGTQFSATKSGYLYGGFRLYAGEEGTSHVDIVLMEAKNLGTLNSSQGGKLEIANNTFVDFPVDAFSANGTDPYNGNVTVLGNWIDPSADNMLALIPGDLSAIDQSNNRVILNSYGMVGIELISDSGQELNLLPGKEAEITMEIPDAFMSSAPSSIPLWNFDEDEGIWKEEGSATLNGNQYVGKVSHFSWWNCDLPNAILPFCITIVDGQTGLEMPNTYVTFDNIAGFGFAAGYTNARGQLCGFIPENMELEVNVGGNLACQNVGSGQVIGPYTTADLPIVITHVVNQTTLINSMIEGVVTDCGGTPVANAFVIFSWGTESVSAFTDSNGSYTQGLISCGEIPDLEIRAISIALEKQHTENITNVNGGMTTVDLSLCTDLIVQNWWFQTSASGLLGFNNVIARVKPFETQIISEEGSNIELMGFECFGIGNCQGSYIGSVGGFTVDLVITEFGAVGEAIKGTFTGVNINGESINGGFEAERVE